MNRTLLATIDHKNGWKTRYYRVSQEMMECDWFFNGNRKERYSEPVAWLNGILKDASYGGKPYRIEGVVYTGQAWLGVGTFSEPS